MNEVDVRWLGLGPLGLRDGGEINAVNVGGGRVGGAKEMGDGASTAADVEEAVGVVEGCVDGFVVHEG